MSGGPQSGDVEKKIEESGGGRRCHEGQIRQPEVTPGLCGGSMPTCRTPEKSGCRYLGEEPEILTETSGQTEAVSHVPILSDGG